MRLRAKEIGVDDLSSLRLKVYTIGYPVEGETILGLFKDSGRTLYSFLIDSYINEKVWYSHVDHLLHKEHTDGIDSFIWTHPDKDHSLDIPRLLDTYDKQRKAQVFLPDIEHLDGIKPVAKATCAYLYDRYSQRGSRRYQVSVVSVDQNEESRTLESLEFFEKGRPFGERLRCKFCFLAPISQFVDRNRHYGLQENYNIFSIVMALNINGRNLLFCGDVEDKSAKLIDDGFLHNVAYVKIPHHTSPSTKGFYQRLLGVPVTEVVAATTVFRKKNLPDEKLLKSYEKICKELYSTGSDAVHSFGSIETTFKLSDMTSITETSGSGKLIYKRVNPYQ